MLWRRPPTCGTTASTGVPRIGVEPLVLADARIHPLAEEGEADPEGEAHDGGQDPRRDVVLVRRLGRQAGRDHDLGRGGRRPRHRVQAQLRRGHELLQVRLLRLEECPRLRVGGGRDLGVERDDLLRSSRRSWPRTASAVRRPPARRRPCGPPRRRRRRPARTPAPPRRLRRAGDVEVVGVRRDGDRHGGIGGQGGALSALDEQVGRPSSGSGSRSPAPTRCPCS